MRLFAILAWSALAALMPAAAAAKQEGSLGKTVTDVRVEIAGIPATDPNVLSLIETRIGEPLAMQAVRSTIDHLVGRSEEHTSELQSRLHLVCRLLLEKKKVIQVGLLAVGEG